MKLNKFVIPVYVVLLYLSPSFPEYRSIVTNVLGLGIILYVMFRLKFGIPSNEIRYLIYLLGWSLISLVIVENYSLYFRDLKKIASAFGMMYAVYYFNMRDKSTNLMLMVYFFTIVIVAIEAVLFGYETIEDTGGRLSSSIGNANGLGLLMLFGLLTGIYLLVTKRKYPIIKPFIAAMLPLCLFVIIETASRKVFAGLILCIGLSYLLMFGKKKGLRIISTTIIIACLFFVNPFLERMLSDTLLVERLEIAVDEGGNEVRENIYADGFRIFLNYPITGVGLGNFIVLSNIGKAAHSDLLDILVKTGIVGFILYILFFRELLKKLFFLKKRTKDNDEDTYYSFVLIFLVLFFVIGLGRENWYDIFTFTYFGILASGITVNYTEYFHQKREQDAVSK